MNFILHLPPAKELPGTTTDLPRNASEVADKVFHPNDHPPVHTEECIAAGCPEDLW